jgi:general secretion pathway protein L
MMRSRLVIRLGRADEAPVYALPEEGEQRSSPARRPLHDLTEVAQGKQVWILVPGTEILATRAKLPRASFARLARAVPYALEERLTEDVESSHFALGNYKEGETAVLVVACACMNAWLEALKTAHIEPHVVMPDFLAVPWIPGAYCVAIEDGLALARTGEQSGFAVEADALVTYLRTALADADRPLPKALHIYVSDESVIETSQDAVAGLDIPVEWHRLQEGLLPYLLEGTKGPQPTLNLLQGPYAHQNKDRNTWRPWRVALVMSVLALLAYGAREFIETARLEAAQRNYAERMLSVFRDTFPEARRVINPEVQMRHQLEELRAQHGYAGDGFLALLADAVEPFDEFRGVELEQLAYQDNQLDLALRADNVQVLDDLKRALQRGGEVEVEILSASAQGRSVQSRVRIQRPAS